MTVPYWQYGAPLASSPSRNLFALEGVAARAERITESLLALEFTQAATLNGLVATTLTVDFNLSVSLPVKVTALLNRTPLSPAVGQVRGATHNAGLVDAALFTNEIAPLFSSNENRARLLLNAVSVGNSVFVTVGDNVRVRVGDKRN